jgi:hypothetical protein
MGGHAGTRVWTAFAAGAAVVAVLVIALPGIGIGDPTTSHGEPDVCAEVDVGGTTAMQTQVAVGAASNLLVYFSSERSGASSINTELLLSFFILDDEGELVVNTPFEWGLSSNPRSHDSGTVMWSFDGIEPGTYDVFLDSRVDPVPGPAGGSQPIAVLENCALAVFVNPVA